MKIGLKYFTLAALFTVPLAGCDFAEQDLKAWPALSKGDQRLAGYYFDQQRPAALRSTAAQLLFDNGQLGQIMGVLRHTDDADRKTQLTELSAHVQSVLGTDSPAPRTNHAVELGFYLLEFHAQMDATQRTTLVKVLLDWSLANFNKTAEPQPRRTPDDLLKATWLVDAPQVQPKVLAWLNTASEPDLIAMLTVLTSLREPAVQRAAATALLDRAKKVHPKLTGELVDAMLNNGNETLLRYLVAAVADIRIEHGVRALAWNEASRRLGAKGVPQYMGLLTMDDPANANDARLLALDAVVQHGGVELLAKALRSLPANGTWPADGDDLRTQVRAFCDTHVARHKVAARPVLVELIDDANWVARAYAMECIMRLYPDDAPDVLIDLLDDDTPLRGFSVEGETTFGAMVYAIREG